MIGDKAKQMVFVGADHAGFKAKNELRDFLKKENYDVTDLGTFSEEPYDYPDIAREVGEKVQEHPGAFGILMCGSGIGVAMAANKLRGIRAVQAINEELAVIGRQHNDANVLTMGGRITDVETMKKIAMKFLKTEFESGEERRVRRVQKMNEM